ncbi:hypothetical protein SPFM9_00223 [Salmonella phage SPFM9]|nr:hypothetical protein SPFM9_00223 [Salmonella phage SPFM9]
MNYPATVLDWQRAISEHYTKNINGYVYNAIPPITHPNFGQEVKEEMFYMEPKFRAAFPLPRDKAIYIPDGKGGYRFWEADWMVLDQYGRFVPLSMDSPICLRNMKMINEKLQKYLKNDMGNSGRSSIDNLIPPTGGIISWGRKAHYRSRTGKKSWRSSAKWKITKQ